MGVPEIVPRETKHGLVADGDGWFVLNAAASRWNDTGPFGAGTSCTARPARTTRSSAPAAVPRPCVERETTKPEEAYAAFPRRTRVAYRAGWLPE
jgi:hypothetical protein